MQTLRSQCYRLCQLPHFGDHARGVHVPEFVCGCRLHNAAVLLLRSGRQMQQFSSPCKCEPVAACNVQVPGSSTVILLQR